MYPCTTHVMSRSVANVKSYGEKNNPIVKLNSSIPNFIVKNVDMRRFHSNILSKFFKNPVIYKSIFIGVKFLS